MEKKKQLTSAQETRLQCLVLANNFACSTNGEICEHEQQRIADEFFTYVMTGKKSTHEAGIEFHGKTFEA